jgi:hypothetical protein
MEQQPSPITVKKQVFIVGVISSYPNGPGRLMAANMIQHISDHNEKAQVIGFLPDNMREEMRAAADHPVGVLAGYQVTKSNETKCPWRDSGVGRCTRLMII